MVGDRRHGAGSSRPVAAAVDAGGTSVRRKDTGPQPLFPLGHTERTDTSSKAKNTKPEMMKLNDMD